MEEELITSPTSPINYKGRLYKTRSLYLAALLGGPFASAYIISHNFRALGQKKKSIITWLALIILLIIAYGVDLVVPKFPNYLFGLAALGLSVSAMNKYQDKAVEQYVEEGHIPYSNWRGLTIGLLSLSIILLLVFGCSYAVDYIENSQAKTEAVFMKGCSAYFRPDNIKKIEVERLASELYKHKFLKDSDSCAAIISKEGRMLVYHFSYLDSVWKKEEYVNYFRAIKDSIQKDFPREIISFYICDSSFTPRLKL